MLIFPVPIRLGVAASWRYYKEKKKGKKKDRIGEEKEGGRRETKGVRIPRKKGLAKEKQGRERIRIIIENLSVDKALPGASSKNLFV